MQGEESWGRGGEHGHGTEGLPVQTGRAEQRLSCWLGSDCKVLPAIWTLSGAKGGRIRVIYKDPVPGQ